MPGKSSFHHLMPPCASGLVKVSVLLQCMFAARNLHL
jgi:hypothetical protein